MAKSGQYIPQRSQPLHFSGLTTCGGWYPRELNAEESARTLVGQNSTQKPHDLQRSTTIDTRPLATESSFPGVRTTPRLDYPVRQSLWCVTSITGSCEGPHAAKKMAPAHAGASNHNTG